jgi:ribosomal protein S18 acetylase RimI-like enzyme
MELGKAHGLAYVGEYSQQGTAVPQPSQTVSIRRATSVDAPKILACLSAAFEGYRSFYTPAAFLDTVLTPETIQGRLAEMTVFVAVNDSSEVVGTIACSVISAEEGHLRGMAVLPSLRGSGIAEQLLSRAESVLRSHQCTRITLDTTEPLQRAMRFYEKYGYRRSGKIADFFGIPLIEYQKVLR